MSESEVSIPSAILDRWMPKLKDTELRLLLIVARQTVGRGGKPADWLSHSQLKTRTGRASEAISTAVNVLIEKSLLIVMDERGALLQGREERRRYRGKAFYQLGLLATGKPKRTEIIETTRPFRFIEHGEHTKQPDAPSPGERQRIEESKRRIRESLRRLPQ